jgi:hypothetical protein
MLKEKDTFIKTLQADHIESIQRHNARIKELQARYDRHCEKQERYITDLVQEQASLENDLVNLRDKCHRLESVALLAQEGALKAMAKGGSAPKEDRLVRNELTKLQDGLRQWARKYAVGAIGEFDGIPSQQKDHVIGQLEGYCVQTDWNCFVRQAPIPQNKIPYVLVEALLAKDIFGQMFADPFFVFPETNNDSTLPARTGMHLLYATMRQGRLLAGALRYRLES